MKLNKLFMSIGIILVSLVLAMSCSDDDKPNGGEKPEPPNPPEITETVKTYVHGFITDENDNPIANATVRSGDLTAQTDDEGFFFLEDAKVGKDVAFINVEKDEYFEGTRSWIPEEDGSQMVIIKLLPKNIVGTIDSKAGGEVTTKDGLKLNFPANSVVVAKNGTAYTGKIRVAAQWLNPVSEDMPVAMPGDLTAIDSEGEMKALITYGMFAVELTTDGGEKLQVAEDKMVAMTAAIPDEMQADAPETMPLWHFDNTKGLWVEDGVAKRVGNEYVGDVSHFSWWNLDAPYGYVIAHGKFVDQFGDPVSGMRVEVRTEKRDIAGGGLFTNARVYTNSSGTFGVRVPKNSSGKVIATYNYWEKDQECIRPIEEKFHVDEEHVKIIDRTVTLRVMEVSGTVQGCGEVEVTGKVIYQVAHRSGTAEIEDGKYKFRIGSCQEEERVSMNINANREYVSWISTIKPGKNTQKTIGTCNEVIIEGDLKDCEGMSAGIDGIASFRTYNRTVPVDIIDGKYRISYYEYGINEEFKEFGTLTLTTKDHFEIYSKEIPVVEGKNIIPTILKPRDIVISGTASNCNGPIKEGVIYYTTLEREYTSYAPIKDGSYTITLPTLKCNATPINLQVVDFEGYIMGEKVSTQAQPGTNIQANIEVCEGKGSTKKINYAKIDLDGQIYYLINSKPTPDYPDITGSFIDGDRCKFRASVWQLAELRLGWEDTKLQDGTYDLTDYASSFALAEFMPRSGKPRYDEYEYPTITGKVTVKSSKDGENIKFDGTFSGKARIQTTEKGDFVTKDIKGNFYFHGENR